MPAHLSGDPVIPVVKKALVQRYGDRLRGILLYGSRARGDFGPDSDYDLVVLLDLLNARTGFTHELRKDGIWL